MKHIITTSKYGKYYRSKIGESDYYWGKARHLIDEKLTKNQKS